ncbi:hypothetical protein [Nocardiopsis alba]|uniref:hypothetical protein n=1 Tax=Nocardiopsis alba TaxID=53437 RepID=UPI0035DB9C31
MTEIEDVGGKPGLMEVVHMSTIEEYSYQAVNRDGSFEHAYQHFLLQHYQLASGVRGTGSTGSLGYGLGALRSKGRETLVPRIGPGASEGRCCHRYSVRLTLGVAFSGSYPEGEAEPVDAMPCAPELMREAMERMFRALRERDRGAWVENFAARQIPEFTGYAFLYRSSHPWRLHRQGSPALCRAHSPLHLPPLEPSAQEVSRYRAVPHARALP